jgi:putative hydrolase of the HAD superfamily
VSGSGPSLDIVFFDIDDTLYSTTAFANSARRNAVAAMIGEGLRTTLEDGITELAEVVAEFSSNYPQHFGRLLDRLGPRAWGGRNRAVLVAAGVVAYHRTKERSMQILEDVRVLLEQLHAAGVRLGVISAGLHVKQAEKLIRLDALRYFDPTAIFFSDQLGVSKPNPKIYAKACAALGIEPERAMYVGDRPAHDVEPARATGLRTVQYTGAGGRYGQEPAEAEPHHRVEDLRTLRGILVEEYGLRL